MTSPTLHELTSTLRTRLQKPLPGTDAQLDMALDYRRDVLLASVKGKRCREAGVLAALFPSHEGVSLVLTVRHRGLRDHAGQISLPGGSREPNETLEQTALREAHEEVNIRPAEVELLGALTPLYIPPSRFCVYPFIGILAQRPTLQPTDAEVAHILEVPLRHLANPATRQREWWTLRGQQVSVPFFNVDGHKVWGATAMILSELLAVAVQ